MVSLKLQEKQNKQKPKHKYEDTQNTQAKKAKGKIISYLKEINCFFAFIIKRNKLPEKDSRGKPL